MTTKWVVRMLHRHPPKQGVAYIDLYAVQPHGPYAGWNADPLKAKHFDSRAEVERWLEEVGINGEPNEIEVRV